MADAKLTALSALTAPTLDDLLYMVDDPAGTPASKKMSMNIMLGFLASSMQGRLTTQSGVPVSTADRTGQSTIFFTPYMGNRISLYNGLTWQLYTLSQVSLALSGLTTDKNYDVFLKDVAGTLTLSLSSPWTNDTTRADALAAQDNINVLGSDHTKRYIGTIRTTGATTTEDSATNRFIWNAYNLVPRPLLVIETASTWASTGTTWAPLNAAVTNRVSMVVGLAGMSFLDVFVTCTIQQTAGIGQAFATVGIGRDSVGGGLSSNDALIVSRWGIAAVVGAEIENAASAQLKEYVALGSHFYQALQWDDNGTGVTILFVGTDTGTNARIAGMIGTFFC